MADTPIYRLVTGSEARSVLADVNAAAVPPVGLIVVKAGRTYLVFRKTTGELLVIDVGVEAPAHFRQTYPAPVGFVDEVMRRLVAATPTTSDLADLVKVALLAAVVFGLVILFTQLRR